MTPTRPAIAFAFQPIVNARRRAVYAYEALVRGPNGESASHVLGAIPVDALPAFDRGARSVALELAASLGVDADLSLNCLPRSVQGDDADHDQILAVAAHHGISPRRLILEVTETEAIVDHARFSAWVQHLRARGARVAIDDFGAGYSGLNLLADFQPEIVKLDMALIRGIHTHGPRQAIVRAVLSACLDLGIDVIAEGVETVDEYLWCADAGIALFQGYLFARPGFACLPAPTWPG